MPSDFAISRVDPTWADRKNETLSLLNFLRTSSSLTARDRQSPRLKGSVGRSGALVKAPSRSESHHFQVFRRGGASAVGSNGDLRAHFMFK